MRCLPILILLCFSLAGTDEIAAQNTHRWLSPAGPHDWDNDGNWDIGKPGPTDNALFDLINSDFEIRLNQQEQIQFFTVRLGDGSLLLSGGNDLEVVEESVVESGTLTFHGANLQSTNDLIIGQGGTAEFRLSAAAATNRDAILGFGGGTGSATLTGSDSVWTNRNLYLGNSGSGFDTGTGHLTINSGARVNVGGGAAEIEGYGLVVRDTPGGSSSTEGNLFLRNGSTLHVDDGVLVGPGGKLSLHGTNTQLTTGADLRISGNDLPSITGGASVMSQSGLVTGTIEVSDANSNWTANDQIEIQLNGSLQVLNGARVETSRFAIGNLSPPFGGNRLAETLVRGAGSRLTVSELLEIGSEEGGALAIFDGGQVSATDLRLDWQNSTPGRVTIDGSGSSLNLQTINGGGAQFLRGNIQVLNGGTVNTEAATLPLYGVNVSGNGSTFSVSGDLVSRSAISIDNQGRLTNGTASIRTNGTVNLDGQGTLWTSRNLFLNTIDGTDDDGGAAGARISTTNGAQLIVGDDDIKNATESLIVSDLGNDGNLILRNGAALDNDADTVVGLNAGSTGQISIDGAFKDPDTSEFRDTRFAQQGTFTIGDAGEGIFNAANKADASAQEIVLANQAGSVGFAVINGDGTTLNAAGDITVGRDGNAGLFVEDGATVSSATGRVGSGDSGLGQVMITGEGSSLNASRFLIGSSDGTDDRGFGNVSMNSGGRLLIGNDFSASPNSELLVSDTSAIAELVLRNGSNLNNSGIAVIGNSAGAEGSVLLNGANSRWSNVGDVTIGLDGTGTLRIENGAELIAEQNASIAENAGSVGNVTVTGSNSQWSIANGLSVGKRGQGSLAIEEQGLVIAPNVNVGFFDSGISEILINGIGSELRSATSLNVGGAGQSTMKIENGGLASSGHGSVSNIQSTVLVTGSQSRWINSETLAVGLGGTMNIENGGFVDGGGQTTVQANGTVGIRGANSELLTTTLTVGANESQAGTVFVEEGGKLTTTFGNVGDIVQTGGLVVVRNANSLWESSSLNIGSTGDGEVKVLSGGSIHSGSGFIGRNGIGSVSVAGSGSTWDVSQQILVGWGNLGDGLLSVGQGGRVESLAISIGAETGARGVLEVNGPNSQFVVEQSISVGSEGMGSLFIGNHGFVSSDSANMGATSTGTAQAIVSTNGVWEIDRALRVGAFGESSLKIESGGRVTVGLDGNGRTFIDEFGSVELSNGTFDFGVTDLVSLERVSGTSGSLFGAVEFEGYNHIETFSLPDLANLDTSGVRLANSGVIHGHGATTFGLQNQAAGEVRVRSDEWMRFGGVGSRNSGELNNFGGVIEFENDLTNFAGGFIAGRGQFIAGGGIINEGVMAFSAGQTDILGDVANLTNGQIVTSGLGTTTFFDDVVHNGLEIRTAEGSATVFLGEYTGAGSFTGTGDVFFEGDLRPGNSPDIVSFGGDVHLGLTAISEFELGGTELGLHDRMEIAGDAYLNGELLVSMIDGFQLEGNQQFMIFDVGGSRFGEFHGLTEGSLVGSFGNRDLFITYGAGDGNDVSLFSAVPEPSATVLLLVMFGFQIAQRRRLTGLVGKV